MKVIVYNKLVRDKIPRIIQDDGAFPRIKRLTTKKRFLVELRKKLAEEVAELQKAKKKKDIVNELSDVLELLFGIARAENLSWKAVLKKQKEKKRTRGGFEKKLFLKSVRKP